MANNLSNVSIQQLKRAVAVREQIQELEQELSEILSSPAGAATGPGRKGRRKMSASARAAIGAAQRARWAKQKGTAATPAKKGRRKMSASARAKISAAASARWAKVKAANRKTLAAA